MTSAYPFPIDPRENSLKLRLRASYFKRVWAVLGWISVGEEGEEGGGGGFFENKFLRGFVRKADRGEGGEGEEKDGTCHWGRGGRREGAFKMRRSLFSYKRQSGREKKKTCVGGKKELVHRKPFRKTSAAQRKGTGMPTVRKS